MSYSMQPQALGYDVVMDTPIGEQVVSFDLKKLSRDVTAQLVADARPRIELEIPAFVDQAVERARPSVRAERDLALLEVDARVDSVKRGAVWFVAAIAAVAAGTVIYLKRS